MVADQHIHFLGIAGIGVSALAQLAIARGARVSGSDPGADGATNPAIRRLEMAGATLYREHRQENLGPTVSLVVTSAAVPDDNPEILEAARRGVPIVSRAEFLGTLMAAHRGPKIAVAGTHGKTTTTAMLGVLLVHAGLDPTVFVGGEVPEIGGNVRIGSEEGPFVAEACEAYDSFLTLKPDIAILTNVEADHLDHYGTVERMLDSFRTFLDGIPGRTGRIVACADDAGALRLTETLLHPRAVTLYGTHAGVRSSARNITLGRSTTLDWVNGAECTQVTLGVPGRHNVLNALAAATTARMIDVPAQSVASGLAEFRGAGRRQEILGEAPRQGGSILVMDDYAHHPTEIKATLSALRDGWPGRRLVAVFQPHLYSRTRDFLSEFAVELGEADALVVTDIYAAREAPIPGVHAADIADLALAAHPDKEAIYVPDKHDLPEILAGMARSRDLVVFLGAGDIQLQAEAFMRLLKEAAGKKESA